MQMNIELARFLGLATLPGKPNGNTKNEQLWGKTLQDHLDSSHTQLGTQMDKSPIEEKDGGPSEYNKAEFQNHKKRERCLGDEKSAMINQQKQSGFVLVYNRVLGVRFRVEEGVGNSVFPVTMMEKRRHQSTPILRVRNTRVGNPYSFFGAFPSYMALFGTSRLLNFMKSSFLHFYSEFLAY